MRILIHNSHIPYSYDLIRALVGTDISHLGWNGMFRPDPDCRIISKVEAFDRDYDLCIADEWDESFFPQVRAGRFIFIAHCERGHPIDPIRKFMSQFSLVVTPSNEKLATWKDLPHQQPFLPISLPVSGDDYPCKTDYSSIIVGTCFNNLSHNAEATHNWLEISRGYESKIVGHNTEPLGDSVVVSPGNWDEYRSHLRSFGVFVHLIEGNITGYSPREAMVSGVPVVTGCTPELYYDTCSEYDIFLERGRFSEKIPQLRARIDELTTNQQSREDMGRRGRKTALRAWPMSKFTLEWRKVCGL